MPQLVNIILKSTDDGVIKYLRKAYAKTEERLVRESKRHTPIGVDDVMKDLSNVFSMEIRNASYAQLVTMLNRMTALAASNEAYNSYGEEAQNLVWAHVAIQEMIQLSVVDSLSTLCDKALESPTDDSTAVLTKLSSILKSGTESSCVEKFKIIKNYVDGIKEKYPDLDKGPDFVSQLLKKIYELAQIMTSSELFKDRLDKIKQQEQVAEVWQNAIKITP